MNNYKIYEETIQKMLKYARAIIFAPAWSIVRSIVS